MLDRIRPDRRRPRAPARCPHCACANVVKPGPCRTTHRPLRRSRRSGPGVAHQISPLSSSRRKIASAVGSTSGSLANGVSRFSRLFSDQVQAAPDAVTIGSEGRVRDDVGPGHRRLLVAFEHDDVVAVLAAESAEAVRDPERRRRRLGSVQRGGEAGLGRRRTGSADGRLGSRRSRNCAARSPRRPFSTADAARLEEHDLVLAHPVAPEEEDAAGRPSPRRPRAGRDEGFELLLHLVPVVDRVLVQDRRRRRSGP